MEVFWLRRENTLSFAGGFYAFPGGRVDASDGHVKVDGAEGEALIQTVPTRGYRFVVPVTRTTMAGRPPAQPIPTRVRVAGAILIVSLVGAGGIWWLNKVHRDRTADQVQRRRPRTLRV